MGRYRFRFSASPVDSWTLHDEARIGYFEIDDIEIGEHEVRVTSALPMHLVLGGIGIEMRIERDELPFELRRGLRWRAFSSDVPH